MLSFSGGRSSAYMLHQTLEANGGMPDGSKVVFANTGKEMPQTLDFVNECSQRWGVTIIWVELGRVRSDDIYESGRHKGKPRYQYETAVVDYETASRRGEPFEALIKARNMLPNPVARFCTADLKVRRVFDVTKGIETHFVGIRADEQRRAQRIHRRRDEKDGRITLCPMYVAGITAGDVGRFWRQQPFDLQLTNDNGTTPMGNCDLCFLKGKRKIKSIIAAEPERVKWWEDMEAEVGNRFRRDYSYAELAANVDEQDDMFSVEFSCFCGD